MVRSNRPRVTPKMVAYIIEAWDTKSSVAIGKELGISDSTVRIWAGKIRSLSKGKDCSKVKKRGRPKEYRLSQASKDKIAKSKTGQIHTYATRAKIAVSVFNYCKQEGTPMPLSIVVEGEHDPNTVEIMRDYMEFGSITPKMFVDAGLELINIRFRGQGNLDGKTEQSNYSTAEITSIDGDKITFSMRERFYMEIPNVLVSGADFFAARSIFAETYPNMPFKIFEMTLRNITSSNIYFAKVRGTLSRQRDTRKLIVMAMNNKPHTKLIPAEYGEMQDDLLPVMLRQCYYRYQITKAAIVCSIEGM